MSELTRDQLQKITKIATKATVLSQWSGKDPETDPKMTKVVSGYDWRDTINKLEWQGHVKVRYTEHEYRLDARDLTWVNGYHISVDTLIHTEPMSMSNRHRDLKRHLLKLLP